MRVLQGPLDYPDMSLFDEINLVIPEGLKVTGSDGVKIGEVRSFDPDTGRVVVALDTLPEGLVGDLVPKGPTTYTVPLVDFWLKKP